ncbi:3-hydroxybutyryl-CoA dehydrogenase [Tepidiphilus thermophilus]|jgi:3-hydroxybutyryl-CoA dehydrogenase|uniref:3-hydroxyacyl-CoA dehydrogenase n=1 Tax=Tepidiphilus thermophilus TaxID=876478 RepID=A0A0K6IPL1_9PROT|nr:3-hydroxybutyryl-CoA dehydrogenase [Tepidiphilus thermophilus]MDK2796754.1 3-hydroxybutyryl-CoA dehydrogenase [Tepidiphilus sp.]CUB05237.1 3-hydroxyacyl-CoA dehydrogenase [Tepidiphilus thermophilus]
MQTIFIVGAGTMGSGIAQVAAQSGFSVRLYDISTQQLERARATISANLDRLVKKEKLTAADKDATLARIATATQLDGVASADLVIEAASENEALKLELFAKLDALAKPEAILASNTSSISITKIAAATKNPARVIGMHFFNPVPVMALIELIRGLQTSDETYQKAEAIAKALGKTPVAVKNSPGFVVNRLLCPMINEAIFALQEGLASAEGIDEAMKLGCNHPIGPLALADLIGLDVELAVMQVLYEGFKDPKFRPAPLLVEMVEAGRLGRKTGEGFYRYDR